MNKSKVSKYISLLLRHNPEKGNLSMDRYGWVGTKSLIGVLNITTEQLNEIVDTNDKKRFEFNANQSKIRACQGHSVDILLGLAPMIPPTILYHGTCVNTKTLITTEGIMKMNRNHVHLSDDIETATKVGSRHGTPILFTVNAVDMCNDGYKFYQSKNGVWLTEYVDPKYIGLAL